MAKAKVMSTAPISIRPKRSRSLVRLERRLTCKRLATEAAWTDEISPHRAQVVEAQDAAMQATDILGWLEPWQIQIAANVLKAWSHNREAANDLAPPDPYAWYYQREMLVLDPTDDILREPPSFPPGDPGPDAEYGDGADPEAVPSL
jgi:hypothetical protein